MSAAVSTEWMPRHDGEASMVRAWAAVTRLPDAQPSPIHTKKQLAALVGISSRTLDKHLEVAECRDAIGAYKTSGGRNAHWRFPHTAPDRLRSYLRTRKVA
jgi:hypothetical protein